MRPKCFPDILGLSQRMPRGGGRKNNEGTINWMARGGRMEDGKAVQGNWNMFGLQMGYKDAVWTGV